jgi:hypothetical protein
LGTRLIVPPRDAAGLCLLRSAAIILTAIALVPSAAHIFEMAGKLGLPRDQYLVVQQIYRGWAWFGTVIIAAFMANLALAIFAARRRERFTLAAIACVAIAASLAVFFILVYPANVATGNWTRLPDNWQTLRAHWEFGHAAGAALMLVAVGATALLRA